MAGHGRFATRLRCRAYTYVPLCTPGCNSATTGSTLHLTWAIFRIVVNQPNLTKQCYTALPAFPRRVMRLSREALSAASHRYSCELGGEAVEAAEAYKLHDVGLAHKYLQDPVVCSLTITTGGEASPAAMSTSCFIDQFLLLWEGVPIHASGRICFFLFHSFCRCFRLGYRAVLSSWLLLRQLACPSFRLVSLFRPDHHAGF